jgi:hypothetical protein
MAFVPFPGNPAEFFYPLLRLEGAHHHPGCVQGQGQDAPVGEEFRAAGKNTVIGVSGGYILDHLPAFHAIINKIESTVIVDKNSSVLYNFSIKFTTVI